MGIIHLAEMMLTNYQSMMHKTCNSEDLKTISLTHVAQEGSPCPEFTETHKCSTVLCAKVLYTILSILDNNCRKCGYKFIYAHKCGFHCANFHEIQSLDRHLWTYCIELHPDQTKSVEIKAKVYL
jgi:hypothetical protein